MTEADPRFLKALFWKKFMRLTRGRIPVLRALDIIAREEKERPFREAIDAVRADIEGGTTLSEAIAKFPDNFSLSVVELVRSAERTGAWDEVLDEIVEGIRDGSFE